MLGRGRTVALALAAAVSSCSLSVLDGLSGGGAGRPGGLDGATATDSGVFGDGGSGDASDGPTASGDGGRWCDTLSPAPKFCDDFDDEGPFTRWSGQTIQGNGAFARDRGAARSPPNSLLLTAPASTKDAFASLQQVFSAGSVSHVRCAYDLRVDARDPTSLYAEVGSIWLYGMPSQHSYYLRLTDVPTANAFTAESSNADGSGLLAHTIPLSAAITFDDWRRVDVDIDLRTLKLTVRIDGAVVVAQALESARFPASPTLSVRAGLRYVPPVKSPLVVRVDNFTVDWD